MYFFGIDPVFLIIAIGCGVLSMIAAARVKSAFHKGSQVALASGLTGAEIAQRILYAKDIHDVEVVEHQGFLSDHYNPAAKQLALSPGVYRGTNAAAAGVAAHEVGHAIQHAHGYAPLKLRSLLVPVASIGSNLGPWLVIAGILLAAFTQGASAAEAGGVAKWLAVGGVALFGAATLFTFITLPVEFDATARAKALLPELNLTRSQEEDATVRSVLGAAGLTYVAAAFTSLIMLLYWAWRAGLIGGRR